MFVFGLQSENVLQTVDVRLQNIAHHALSISSVDFGFPANGGMRTAAEQNYLYLSKRSNADGYEKMSLHQTGKALDFFAYVDNRATWDHKHLALVACAFLQSAIDLNYKIEWGGLWKGFSDMPHIQLKD